MLSSCCIAWAVLGSSASPCCCCCCCCTADLGAGGPSWSEAPPRVWGSASARPDGDAMGASTQPPAPAMLPSAGAGLGCGVALPPAAADGKGGVQGLGCGEAPPSCLGSGGTSKLTRFRTPSAGVSLPGGVRDVAANKSPKSSVHAWLWLRVTRTSSSLVSPLVLLHSPRPAPALSPLQTLEGEPRPGAMAAAATAP
jgi:hypothetical protein